MSDFKAFLSWTYSPAVQRDRQEIILSLVQEVIAGVYDPYTTKIKSSIVDFENAVSSRMLSASRHSVKNFKLYNDGGNDAELLLRVVRGAMERTGVRRIFSVQDTPLQPQLIAENLEIVDNAPFWKISETSVQGAYDRALLNITMSDTRRVLLYAIPLLLKSSPYSEHPPINGFSEIHERLFEVLTRQLLNLTMFGGLLGGEAAATATKIAATRLCHKEDPDGVQFAVIHHIHPDSHHPGSYFSSDSKALSDDIRKKFNDLT